MKIIRGIRYLAASVALLLFAMLPQCAEASTFTDNGDGTLTDVRTSLIWWRCSLGQTWDGTTCTGTAGFYSLSGAAATTFTFAGYSDWRVPTADEIGGSQGIYDATQPAPYINHVAFPNFPSYEPWYWTSTFDEYQPHPDHYWLINFDSVGNEWGDDDLIYPYYHVLLVRTPVAVGFYPVNVTAQGGTITSTPAGITNCTGSCSAAFPNGAIVTLTATPSAGFIFSGWSGDDCTGTTTCTVTMNGTKNIVATFSQTASIAFSMVSGWNLLGNSETQPITVATLLGDPSVVTTVWKWDSSASNWQFYSPQMDAATLQSYAASKGYAVLSQLQPGDGFWVNSKQQTTLPPIQGFLIALPTLRSGWNLIATGRSATAPQLSALIGNVTTLWAWNNQSSSWYFYAASLDANGTLAAYIASKGYLAFGSMTVGNGMGLWVNKP